MIRVLMCLVFISLLDYIQKLLGGYSYISYIHYPELRVGYVWNILKINGT